MVDEDEVLELVKDGKSFGEAAKILNCSKSTIARICKKHKVKSQFSPPRRRSFWARLLRW